MSEVGKVIWETSRRDEGTISVMGADIIAVALEAKGLTLPEGSTDEYRVQVLWGEDWWTLSTSYYDREEAEAIVSYARENHPEARVVCRKVSPWKPVDL